MKINKNGFNLNTANISNTSAAENNIVLPYTGESISSAESAAVYFNVKPTSVRIVLQVSQSGKIERFPIDAEKEEIAEVLNRFFFNSSGGTRFDCGLSPYWLGIWQAHFIDWKNASIYILDVIDNLSTEDKAKIEKHLTR